MLGALKAAIDFLEVCQKTKKRTTNINALATQQKKNLLMMFGRVAYDMRDATESLVMLNSDDIEMPFTEDDRAELASCIETVVELNITGASVSQTSQQSMKQRGQMHCHMDNYLTEGDWEKILPDISFEDECQVVINRGDTIGCRYWNERSALNNVVILNQAKNRALNPLQAWDQTQRFRILNETIRKPNRHKLLLMATYPESVNDFIQLHPDCYDDSDCPNVSRVDKCAVARIQSALPCRKNSKMLQMGQQLGMMGQPMGMINMGMSPMLPACNSMDGMHQPNYMQIMQQMQMHQMQQMQQPPDDVCKVFFVFVFALFMFVLVLTTYTARSSISTVVECAVVVHMCIAPHPLQGMSGMPHPLQGMHFSMAVRVRSMQKMVDKMLGVVHTLVQQLVRL